MPTPKIAGLQEIRRQLKDGSTVVNYRVQIKRKDFTVDKLFKEEEFDEAVELINAAKSHTGKNKIKLLEEQRKKEMELIADYMQNPPLSLYIEKYIATYVKPRYKNCDPATDEGKFKLRNLKTTLSFYKQIENTVIPVRIDDPAIKLSPLLMWKNDQTKKFGSFKPLDITEIEINEFVKELLKNGLKPISIQRYITHISNVFKKIRYMDSNLKTLRNPCLDYDRDLLKEHGNLIVKKPFRFTDDEKKKLFEELEKYPNREMKDILNLMLFTALRRSEVVLLKWSQVSENSIYLHHTKSGRPRTVYLIPEAKELLKSIPKRPGDDRIFTYSVLGFDGSLTKFLERIGLSHVSSHSFRKESISAFIEAIGAQNSLLMAEFLGLASVRKLEQTIESQQGAAGLNTQKDVLKSVGHTNAAITQNHYFSLRK